MDSLFVAKREIKEDIFVEGPFCFVSSIKEENFDNKDWTTHPAAVDNLKPCVDESRDKQIAVIDVNVDDLARRYQCRVVADDTAPECVTGLGEGASQKGIVAREVFDGSRPTQPHIGGDGLSAPGQGPAAGQVGEILP